MSKYKFQDKRLNIKINNFLIVTEEQSENCWSREITNVCDVWWSEYEYIGTIFVLRQNPLEKRWKYICDFLPPLIWASNVQDILCCMYLSCDCSCHKYSWISNQLIKEWLHLWQISKLKKTIEVWSMQYLFITSLCEVFSADGPIGWNKMVLTNYLESQTENWEYYKHFISPV